MGKYSFQDFVADNVTAHVLKEDWNKFLDLCKTNQIRVRDEDYRADGYMQSFGKSLSGAWVTNGDPIVEFRDMEDVFPPCKSPLPESFLSGKIGICCDTREEYDKLMRMCEANGITWNSGKPATGQTPSKAMECGDSETFRAYGKTLVYNILDADNAVPFSTLFPADPWADFIAGRCYLRVTKAEWAEFVRRCKAANLKWFLGGPDAHVKEFERGNNCARVDRDGCVCLGNHSGNKGYEDRPIHPFSAVAPEPVARKIIITTDGRVTTARLIDGKQTIKTATARCNEGDKFDFEVGASISMNRLIHGKDFPNASPDHFAAWAKQLRALADEVAKASE